MTTARLPRFDRFDDPAPHARLLSNGHYTVLLTSAGTGYSAWGQALLTAWDGDRTEDGCGWFIYLRDLDSGEHWSAGYQPVPDAGRAAATYQPGCVTLVRRVADVESSLRVCVAPDADVEIRRLTLTNRSKQSRRIEITSCVEVVLNQAAAHAAHPAFSKLFVETELDAATGALLARRRPRSHDETPPWMGSAFLGDGRMEHETDRARFAGRNRPIATPAAMAEKGPLSGSVGSVLDTVFALRRIAVLLPGQSVHLHLLLAAGADRSAVVSALTRTGAAAALATVFERAAAQESERDTGLGIDSPTAAAYQELAGAVLYGHPALRAEPDTIAGAHGAPAQLWQYALGGGPFMVVRAESAADLSRVKELLTARAYWAQMGIRVDLAVLCGAAVDPATVPGLGPVAPGGGTLFVRRQAELPAGDVDVLLAAAQFVAGRFALTELAPTLGAAGQRGATATAPPQRRSAAASAPPPPAGAATEALRFANGVGGFSADGTEYAMQLDGERRPPLAWVNVIANANFGCFVSESGAAHTWSRNSHEHRLSPWYNDPLRDPHGEALYVRDDVSGAFWSPQPGPAPDGAAYEVRHGFGYSTWRHRSGDLTEEVVAFVAADEPLRIVRVRLINDGPTVRRVSVFSYQRLVLGVLSSDSARYVVTEHDSGAGMLLAHNRVNFELSDGEVFATTVCESPGAQVAWTADRTSFIGRNGTPHAPAAIARGGALDGVGGAGLDPCFALQLTCEIAPGATAECAFLLGDAPDRAAAAAVVARYRSMAAIEGALQKTRAFWHTSLTAVQVETPVPAIDLMLNGWLLYQALSCRLWGRSALYQSGGAFGFRDQLQDSAALVYAHPELTRAQILLHAAHQFVEGDVLHWWHPPASRGTRTRFSDDLLWLPYIACFYARTTGDWGVFDEQAGFLRAPLLQPGEDEAYLLPAAADEPADLYTHCCRAIDRSLTRGAHGLPLMGTGDWNDGMNRVGRQGQGESVWLGFFLYQVLADFLPLCERRGDSERAARYTAYRRELGTALNAGGWDGAWYRRAYYDDGAPLGSAQNAECRIDVLAQAWAVISGAASPERASQAMDAVEAHLVDREAGLIRLLTPPFDRDPHDPGYIKGYVPGIRENGGQYTHGATWALRAFAEAGRRDRAAAYLEMLSPMSHTATAERLAVYQVEPYVIVADIYGVAPHRGRGGWTWYTGSASWMFRVALESVLGIRIEEGQSLIVAPRVPDGWPGFKVRMRLADGRTLYDVQVENPTGNAAGVVSASADGAAAAIDAGAARVALQKDGKLHYVRVILGPVPPP